MDYQTFFQKDVGVKNLKWSDDQGIGWCPFPEHNDKTSSWLCNRSTGQWICYSCGKQGNAFSLAKTLNLKIPHYELSGDSLGNQAKNNYPVSGLNEGIGNAIEHKNEIPKRIGAFSVITGEEASNIDPPPTEWLIENILPKKFNTLLAGTTGCKKSFYALQLAMCLANGERKFCGNRIIPDGIKVLFVDTEIGEDELLRRYQKIQKNMNWNGNNNITFMSKDGSHEDVWKEIHKIIELYKPELIIIDSLYNSTSVDDFSKSSGMSKVINELAQFKIKYGVTVFAIAHFNKGQHEQGLVKDRMQGSAVLQNWAEYIMLMDSTNIDGHNLWKVDKARGVHDDKSYILLQWDDFWFKAKGVIDDPFPLLVNKNKKRKWQDVLDDCPKQFNSQDWLNVFRGKHNFSDRTGREWLNQCSRTPMLKRIGHNQYEKGLSIIDGKEMVE